MKTTVQRSTQVSGTPFTDEEAHALEAVRIRFGQDHDVLSEGERQRLCFLRWLVRNGRLVL